MKKYNQRAAAFGMAGALALGTVVSAGVMAPADAASGTYTCTLTSGDVPLTVAADLGLPSQIESGRSLSGLTGNMSVTLPAPVVAGLAGLGIQSVGGTASGVAFPVGASKILLNDITIPQTGPSGDGSLTLASPTSTKGAKAPLPGSYPVEMPKSFSFVPIANFGGGVTQALPAVPCVTDSPASLGTLTVVKAASTTKVALLNAPVTTTKHAKLGVTVRAAGGYAAGTVVAKEGTHKLASGTLTKGKKTLVLPLLKKGAHTIKVVYKGNAGTKSSSKSISFTVKRG